MECIFQEVPSVVFLQISRELEGLPPTAALAKMVTTSVGTQIATRGSYAPG